MLFPELGISGYSNEDLFHQDALLDATSEAVLGITDADPQWLTVDRDATTEYRVCDVKVKVKRPGVPPNSFRIRR